MGQSKRNDGSRRAPGRPFSWLAAAVGLPLAAAPVPSAFADVEANKAAIAARLQRWTEAFNARDATRTCDPLTRDLAASVRGAADPGRYAICAPVAAALAHPKRRSTYAAEIREIVFPATSRSCGWSGR